MLARLIPGRRRAIDANAAAESPPSFAPQSERRPPREVVRGAVSADRSPINIEECADPAEGPASACPPERPRGGSGSPRARARRENGSMTALAAVSDLPLADLARGSVRTVRLEAPRLVEVDAALAAVWPRPRRHNDGTCPDVQRIAMLLQADDYTPLRVDPELRVVDPDGEALLEAARVLGWTTIRVRVEERVDDPIVLLADKLRREHYPISRILAIVTSPVFWKRFTPIVEAARARMLGGTKLTKRTNSRDVIAESLGMIGRGRAVQTILRARRILGDALLDEIARGETHLTMDGLQRAMRASADGAAARRGVSPACRPILTDNWQCSANSGTYGVPGFDGGAPDEIVAHFIETCTERGDLVVDPMAGSGRTIDLARALGREVIAADQAPKRADIRQHRIEDGPIPEVGRGTAQLVILDPPYCECHDYGETSSGRLPWRKFLAWLGRVAASAYAMTKPGGFTGSIVMNVRAPNRTRRLLRHELERAMLAAGWMLDDELVATGALWPSGETLQRAKAERFVVGKSLYVQTWKKPKTPTPRAPPTRRRGPAT